MNNVSNNNNELEKIKAEFYKDFNRFAKHGKPFREICGEILEGETEMSFMARTGLSSNMLYRLKSHVDEKDPVERRTLISLCIGYDLDILMTTKLLHSLGLDINPYSKRDYAYTYLLTRCRGMDVESANEILKYLGFEDKYLLGTYARKNGGK